MFCVGYVRKDRPKLFQVKVLSENSPQAEKKINVQKLLTTQKINPIKISRLEKKNKIKNESKITS